ncbi:MULTISPECIES: S-layer homology domain-containing protein [unclassified Paenibacillus]
MSRYEDDTFRPDNTITRAEIIAIISRLVDLQAVKKGSHKPSRILMVPGTRLKSTRLLQLV